MLKIEMLKVMFLQYKTFNYQVALRQLNTSQTHGSSLFANRLLLELEGKDGVEFASYVFDLTQYSNRSRIAVFS